MLGLKYNYGDVNVTLSRLVKHRPEQLQLMVKYCNVVLIYFYMSLPNSIIEPRKMICPNICILLLDNGGTDMTFSALAS